MKGGLFIFDKGIELIDVQPLKSKEAVSMGHAVRQHKGRRVIKSRRISSRGTRLVHDGATILIQYIVCVGYKGYNTTQLNSNKFK